MMFSLLILIAGVSLARMGALEVRLADGGTVFLNRQSTRGETNQ